MSGSVDDRSRLLGAGVCGAALLAGVLFLYGLTVQSYWAIALPVGVAFLFVLWLVFWVGWTIATVRVEASGDPLPPAGGGATPPARGPGPPPAETTPV
jgi:hypothetical protein